MAHHNYDRATTQRPIDGTLSYRVGGTLSYRVGSQDLLPLPLETLRQQEFTEWNLIRDVVTRILQEERVHTKQVEVVRRHHKGADPKASQKTIFVISDASIDGQHSCWMQAAHRIDGVLLEFKRTDIMIEIVDQTEVLRGNYEPVEEDSVVASWLSVQDQILSEIDGWAWLSVDVIMRSIGIAHPKRAPTVMITTADKSHSDWWSTLMPRLRKCLPHGFDIDLVYSKQVLCLGCIPLKKNEEDLNRRPEIFTNRAAYEKTVAMGSSVGLDPTWTGTVGTAIDLIDAAGNTIKCALTNHHVLNYDEGIAKETDRNRYIGPSHRLASEGMVTVYSPSQRDHERLLNWSKFEATQLAEAIKNDGTSERDNQCAATAARDRLNAAQSNLDFLERSKKEDRRLGTMFSVSGYRAREHHMYTKTQTTKLSKIRDTNLDKSMDGQKEDKSLAQKRNGKTLQWGLNWALIRLDPARRSMSNKTPTPMAAVSIPSSATVSRFGPMNSEHCYQVTKHGRTTGWTTGVVSKIGSFLHLRYDKHSVIPADLDHRFGTIVLAFVVLSSSRHREFLAPGDSGSVILANKDGHDATVLGLGFAANSATLVSYMTPFDLVVADIEHVTGYKVKMPEYHEASLGSIIPDSP
jgi:hypothetical protein